MRPRGAAARSQARIFRRDGGKEEEGGVRKGQWKGRRKIVTVAGHLTLRGLRIRTRPRSNKCRRRPKPMRCLSADNGDQFWAEKKNLPTRNVGRGFWPGREEELPAAAKEVGKGGCGLGLLY